jgi:hypothetical protein
MAKGYSKDLRARAVALVEDGESRREAARVLGLGQRAFWNPSDSVLHGCADREAPSNGSSGARARKMRDDSVFGLFATSFLTAMVSANQLTSTRQLMTVLPPAYVSLFSGAGGLDLGLERSGWQTAYATDNDLNAVESLKANVGRRIGRGRRAFAGTFIEQADVQTLTAG